MMIVSAFVCPKLNGFPVCWLTQLSLVSPFIQAAQVIGIQPNFGGQSEGSPCINVCGRRAVTFPGLVGFLIKSPPANKVFCCGYWFDMLNPGKARRSRKITVVLGSSSRYADFNPLRLFVGSNVETVMSCIIFRKSGNLTTSDFQVIGGKSGYSRKFTAVFNE